MAQEINSNDSLEYIVYIPDNINIDALLVANLLPFHIPNARDYLIYILSLINVRETYTYLNSVKIQKLVDNYSPLLNWLLHQNILETDGLYKIGSKTLGYRFTQYYIESSLKPEVIRKRTLIRKILKHSEIKKTEETIVEDTATDGDSEWIEFTTYQNYWYSYKEVATILGLRPGLMLKGLRKFKILDPDPKNYNIGYHRKKLYYHEIVWARGRAVAILKLNINIIPIIRNLATQHPADFPQN